MPAEVHLTRVDNHLNELEITIEEWESCLAKIESLRMSENAAGNQKSIECYCVALQDWIPVFWLDNKGCGFMKESGFFKFEESYAKAIEIAQHLKAIISGEEGVLLFKPNYRVLYDDCEIRYNRSV